MAWHVGLGRVGWMGAALCVGCTAPNPAYDLGAGSGTQGGSTAPTSTADRTEGAMDTGNDSSGAGSDSGVGTCADSAAGTEVSVLPMAGLEPGMCGNTLAGTGLLVTSGASYTLYLDEACQMTEPLSLVFLPKGPSIASSTQICVLYELRYRADCQFDSAEIRHRAMDGGGLIYASATVPTSNVPELTLEEDPVGDACDCATSTCCEGALPPGPYALLATTIQGESKRLEQAGQTTFTMGPHTYELAVPQARVTASCDDPMQFDWYYRQLNAG